MGNDMVHMCKVGSTSHNCLNFQKLHRVSGTVKPVTLRSYILRLLESLEEVANQRGIRTALGWTTQSDGGTI